MPLALVTGPRLHLGPAAATLARAGLNVVTWETPAPPPAAPHPQGRLFPGLLGESNAGTGPDGPFDCYVQLPCRGAAPGPAAELVCRIDTLAAVAPRLSPTASVLFGVEESTVRGGPHFPSADPRSGPVVAADLLVAVALALLEDLGRPAASVAVLSVGDLCRPAPAFARIDPVVGATQWEMPTPPLVSAP